MQDLQQIFSRRVGHSPKSQILDDQQRDPGHLCNVGSAHPGGSGFSDVLEQIESRLVLYPVTRFHSLDSHRDDQMCFADSRLTDDQPAATLFDESASGQIKDLLPIDRGVEREPEVLQEFAFRELGLAETSLQQTVAAAGEFVVDEQLKELLMRETVQQELLLRGSRDFSERKDYEQFVQRIIERRNAGRQRRLREELEVMRPLPDRRLEDFIRFRVKVATSSTIRVRNNTYSVDSRLIREQVEARLYADHVEVRYGGQRVAEMPRLRGEGKHRIDYRHVIHSLVRKPGAFARYRWREDLFPGVLFRVAYDELREDCPQTADRQYLGILELAAQEGERKVEQALKNRIESGRRTRFQDLKEDLIEPVLPRWQVQVPPINIQIYDRLLGTHKQEVRP